MLQKGPAVKKQAEKKSVRMFRERIAPHSFYEQHFKSKNKHKQSTQKDPEKGNMALPLFI